MMRILPSLTLFALLLASCASPPVFKLGQTGTPPPPAGFALLPQDGEKASPLEAFVAARLSSAGFVSDGQPQYLVQVVSSHLPGKVGLFLPEASQNGAGQHSWRTAPTRSASHATRNIAVSLTDAATGREIYRVYGVERTRQSAAEDGGALADAALKPLIERPSS